MFIFDETINTLLTRVSSLGTDLKKHMDSGHVTIQQIDPAELCPGQLAHAIRLAVEEQQTSIVVIDSLNGYLNAMPGEQFLTIQLHELLSYLNQMGVVTLLIGAHQGADRHSNAVSRRCQLPDGCHHSVAAASEAYGEVRQAISIIKKRGGNHERTIREFRLDAGRIRVGEPLREFRGVLTGVPTYDGVSEPLMKKERP